MIYIDSSVVLGRLFSEARAPSPEFWRQPMVSSRLLEYEVWNRVHAYGLAASHGSAATALLRGIELIDMERPVLASALQPLPLPVRTLDALHLATIHYLRTGGEEVELASYDKRLLTAAQGMGIKAAPV